MYAHDLERFHNETCNFENITQQDLDRLFKLVHKKNSEIKELKYKKDCVLLEYRELWKDIEMKKTFKGNKVKQNEIERTKEENIQLEWDNSKMKEEIKNEKQSREFWEWMQGEDIGCRSFRRGVGECFPWN